MTQGNRKARELGMSAEIHIAGREGAYGVSVEAECGIESANAGGMVAEQELEAILRAIPQLVKALCPQCLEHLTARAERARGILLSIEVATERATP